MAAINFKSEGHKERLLEVIQRIDKVWPEENNRVDPEYLSALYILTSDAASWEWLSTFVSRDGIGFKRLLTNAGFSSGEMALINLAWNLFNNGEKVNVLDLLSLDDSNFHIAMTAITLRRAGAYLHELEAWPD